MTTVKRFALILCAGMLVVSISSCKDGVSDYLNNENKSNLSESLQWETESNADIFLNDIYGSLPNYWNEPENLDNFTDDNDAGYYYTSYNWKGGNVNPSSNDYTVWGGTTGPADLTNWEDTFANIRKCNTFIQKIQENQDNYSQEWINRRIDEAKFLRAYFYSEFYAKIGGLPIITEVMDRSTMDSTDIYQERASFKETTDFLTTELNTIVENGNLEVKYNQGNADAGRATLGAALMLKGWIELYAASPAYNAATPAAGANPDGVA